MKPVIRKIIGCWMEESGGRAGGGGKRQGGGSGEEEDGQTAGAANPLESHTPGPH